MFLLLFGEAATQGRQQPPDDPGWTVFAEFTIAREQPRADSPVVERLPHGAIVHGEYYVDAQTDEDWILAELDGDGAYVPRWDVYRIHPGNAGKGDLPIGEEFVNRWWGMPIDYEPSDLQVIPAEYRFTKDREYQLRREALAALVEMLDAAKQDGIVLLVNSAYRSGPYQKGLYENAVKKDGAKQRYSAPPGHSEHQLGTCVDLTDAAGKYAFTEELATQPEGIWLEKNAARFGFRRSYYPENVKETGYISEPWHWRYWGKAARG